MAKKKKRRPKSEITIPNIPGVKLSDLDPRTYYANTQWGYRDSSQAERVIKCFGSPRYLYSALREIGLNYNLSTIYKWTYPTSKGGRGGLIPSNAWRDIIAAARYVGVVISSEDLDPRNNPPLAAKQRRRIYKWEKEWVQTKREPIKTVRVRGKFENKVRYLKVKDEDLDE